MSDHGERGGVTLEPLRNVLSKIKNDKFAGVFHRK